MRGHCPRFEQGGEVRFGMVGVSRRGVSVARPGLMPARLPWSRITGYRLESGWLVVESTDEADWRLPTGRIPNLSVLLHVFEQLAVRTAPPVTDSLASVLPDVK